MRKTSISRSHQKDITRLPDNQAKEILGAVDERLSQKRDKLSAGTGKLIVAEAARLRRLQ